MDKSPGNAPQCRHIKAFVQFMKPVLGAERN